MSKLWSGVAILVMAVVAAVLVLGPLPSSQSHLALGQVAATPTSTPTGSADPSVVGQWSQLYSWPEVAVHLAVVPDGRIVTFTDSAWNDGLQTPASSYIVTVPSGGVPGTAMYIPDGTDDIWCAGATFFADGRLMVAGGTDTVGVSGPGTPSYNIFDWRTTAWTLGTNMNFSRWYPTTTTLADGEVLALSGSEDSKYTNASTPEVTTNAGAGPWRELTTAVQTLTLYPRAFLAPNGKVFIATGGSPPGANQVTRYLDTSGTGAWSTLGSSLYGSRYNGTAVMYDVGKIMIAGGTDNFQVDPATNTAEVINLGDATPTWRYTKPMALPRQYLNSTLLPDGKVLVTGGTGNSDNILDSGAALGAEMWDPATETWTTMASMNHARLYHSTAALLPDGRVISAGGTTSGVAGNDVDFYSPPYLFNGPRPVISSAPAAVNYGQTFAVQSPDATNIGQVNWIRMSSVTHAFNENQRINRLSFTSGPGVLNVTAPTDPNLCPPGHYMMFILNGSGVPSVAAVVQITSSTTPTPSPTSSDTPTQTPSATPTPTTQATPTATATATPSFAMVAGVNASTTGAQSLKTTTWKPQAGNMIAVFVEVASTSVNVGGVTDQLGNLYNFASARTGADGRVELWYSLPVTGGSSNSVTVNLTASAEAAARVEEFSGVSGGANLLQAGSNAGPSAGTNATTANVTTSVPSFLVADIGWDTAAIASATQGGFARIGQLTNADSRATICYLYAKASAPGTFGTGVTLSAGSNWQGVVAAFGSGPSPSPTATTTPSPTASASATPTATPSSTPTSTATATPTATVPTSTPTPTVLVTASPTATPTATSLPPTLRSVSTNAPSAAATSIAISVPSGTVDGDVMVAFIAVRASTITINPPAGWVPVRNDTFNASPYTSVATYTRTASGEPPSYTWTMSSSVNAAAAIATYFHCAGIDASNGQGNAAGTFSSTAPGVTPGNGGDVLLELFSPAAGVGYTAVTLPASAIPRWNFGMYGISQAMGDELLNGSGTTGNRTATLNINDRANVGQLIALKPGP